MTGLIDSLPSEPSTASPEMTQSSPLPPLTLLQHFPWKSGSAQDAGQDALLGDGWVMSLMSREPAVRGGWESTLGLNYPSVCPWRMLYCLEKGHVALPGPVMLRQGWGSTGAVFVSYRQHFPHFRTLQVPPDSIFLRSRSVLRWPLSHKAICPCLVLFSSTWRDTGTGRRHQINVSEPSFPTRVPHPAEGLSPPGSLPSPEKFSFYWRLLKRTRCYLLAPYWL